jgi:hypothetical protein
MEPLSRRIGRFGSGSPFSNQQGIDRATDFFVGRWTYFLDPQSDSRPPDRIDL